MKLPRTLFLVAAVSAAIVLSACSGPVGGSAPDSSPAGTSSSSSSAANTLVVTNFAFGVLASVVPGTTITVVNSDAAPHTVTSDTAGDFDVPVDGNSTTTFTAPTKPGSYPFHCTYHSQMTAVLVVK